MTLADAFARESARAQAGCRDVLDCGSGEGHEWRQTFGEGRLGQSSPYYTGLEWNIDAATTGRQRGLNIVSCDLNQPLPVASESQDCVIVYSVLEHLMMPCRFLTECQRVLRKGGRLVILTPNISTYFTALLILAGRMPSSGPHPDSNSLVRSQELFRVTSLEAGDLTGNMPEHRHLIVFSFSALRTFLASAGLTIQAARGFGYYPLPQLVQPVFEHLDPYHCHQMVFVCTKE